MFEALWLKRETMNTDSKGRLIKVFLVSSIAIYYSYPPETGFTLLISQGFLAVYIVISLLYLARVSLKHRNKLFQSNKTAISVVAVPLWMLTLGLFGFNFLGHIHKNAKDFVTTVAHKVNQSCKQTNICPKHPENWHKYDSRYKYDYSYLGTKFYLYYTSDNDTFNVYLNYGLDATYSLYGGVGKEVSTVNNDQP